MVISCDQVKILQKSVNYHSKWLRKIFGLGSSWGLEERLGNNMTDKGEVVGRDGSLLLFKLLLKGPPT